VRVQDYYRDGCAATYWLGALDAELALQRWRGDSGYELRDSESEEFFARGTSIVVRSNGYAVAQRQGASGDTLENDVAPVCERWAARATVKRLDAV